MDIRATSPHTNRLIDETSPYLLQHAHNPVDWYPWSPEALAKARAEDKPILISIGYSACHWCHVMEHESFEDDGVARVMNELFVCIKVDREERPDLDKIYQLAHQMLTQRPGGWPLNMFLTPDDRTPFFGGTYFPKEAKHNMPPFTEILQRVATYYREHRADVEKQNDSVRAAFARIASSTSLSDARITPALLDKARQEIESQYEPRFGGFGQAPKFPHPTTIERLLRHWAASDAADAQALEMARFTLHAMAAGGVYDQLGGGFCRYSVDDRWMIPHFEKMLYDNGPLLVLYADAAIALDDAVFKRIACETGDWILREMQAPAGGYYSTLDADSEGHEGKFYVWTREEVARLLTPDEYGAVELRYGFDGAPNFENAFWNLHIYKGIDAVAEKLGRDQTETANFLTAARAKLFAAREQRIRPGRDEKILTSWNGLAIKGMARAGRLLGRTDFIDSAFRALDFVRTQLWQGGRLLATHKDGKSHLNAYLDDYAFLIDGILELLQARWRDGDLAFAIALADVLLERFQDSAHGGFFFTSDDHEKLVYRPKTASDEATPSGNGIAAQVLLRLGHLLARNDYLDAAERTLLATHAELARYPSAHNALLTAVEEYLEPPTTVVLRGNDILLTAWRHELESSYVPRRFAVAIPPDVASLPGILTHTPAHGDAVAYICTGGQCQAPTTDIKRFATALGQTSAVRGPV